MGDKSAPQRNQNIFEIEMSGRMQWQKNRGYGRRNYSELGVQRYQRIFGDTMHARDFSRQKQEAMIASGALNKMTSLGMPQSPCEIQFLVAMGTLKDVLLLMEKVEQAEAGFQSLTEAIDTRSAGGRMMMQIVGSFAEFERAMLRERTRNGLNAARRLCCRK